MAEKTHVDVTSDEFIERDGACYPETCVAECDFFPCIKNDPMVNGPNIDTFEG